MSVLTAAAIQLASGSDLEHNLARVHTLARRARARGATLIALPEVFAWRGARAAEPSMATSVPGRVSEFLCALAAELGAVVIGGSFLERGDPGARSFNTSLLIDADGTIRATYRKIHLFDVDLPGQVTVRESDTRASGAAVVTGATAAGTIGLSVCYDLRFPELYRRLTHAGATILAVPSAFTFVTGAAHWEILLRARAIENQAYVIAPNQSGVGPTGIPDYGHSMIVDPWGVVLARAAAGEQIVLAEIDAEHLARVRREMPCLQHARLAPWRNE